MGLQERPEIQRRQPQGSSLMHLRNFQERPTVVVQNEVQPMTAYYTGQSAVDKMDVQPAIPRGAFFASPKFASHCPEALPTESAECHDSAMQISDTLKTLQEQVQRLQAKEAYSSLQSSPQWPVSKLDFSFHAAAAPDARCETPNSKDTSACST